MTDPSGASIPVLKTAGLGAFRRGGTAIGASTASVSNDDVGTVEPSISPAPLVRANPLPGNRAILPVAPGSARDKTPQTLSDEQQAVLDAVAAGHNVLVDAVAGSGKTSTIQKLCAKVGAHQQVLYLTYSKLLKLEAQARVGGARVQNYHGVVYPSLLKAGLRCGISESILTFNNNFRAGAMLHQDFPVYDMLVIDEYQDITEDYARLIINIASLNPKMQIVMVGDMAQKIRTDTVLDVADFVEGFITHGGRPVSRLPFTRSFRLGPELGELLSDAWDKPLVGVNAEQAVSMISYDEALGIMAKTQPSDLLCLGPRRGGMARALNWLEKNEPERFHKNNVFASIRNSDSGVYHDDHSAIFTTFDSAKGLERDTVMVFDFTEQNWETRVTLPGAEPLILRNIFLVAASRGKRRIFFVRPRDWSSIDQRDFDRAAEHTLVNVQEAVTEVAAGRPHNLSSPVSASQCQRWQDQLAAAATAGEPAPSRLSESIIGLLRIATLREPGQQERPIYEEPVAVTSCFEFKYIENVQVALALLDRRRLDRGISTEIEIERVEGLIDLSPALGVYQEAVFFRGYDPVDQMNLHANSGLYEILLGKLGKDSWRNSLVVCALENEQMRYVDQVTYTVPKGVEDALVQRLGRRLSPDCDSQVPVSVTGVARDSVTGDGTRLTINGLIDAVHQGVAWELKFVSELGPEMFLQLGTYLAMSPSRISSGVLWNTRTGERWAVSVPNRERFLDAVVLTLSKQAYDQFRY